MENRSKNPSDRFDAFLGPQRASDGRSKILLPRELTAPPVPCRIRETRLSPTIKEFPMPTAQEVFDKVATHLLAQGKRSLLFLDHEPETGGKIRREVCAYRGADGTKCAVGCLIPDEKYDPLIEGTSIRVMFSMVGSFKRKSLLLSQALAGFLEHQDLLNALQHVHDDSTPEYWDIYLRQVAQRFGLDSSVIDRQKVHALPYSGEVSSLEEPSSIVSSRKDLAKQASPSAP
jgi:hypothetical protein